jgi:hypothetical protein
MAAFSWCLARLLHRPKIVAGERNLQEKMKAGSRVIPAQMNRLNWLKTTIQQAYVSLPPLTAPKS